MSIQNKFSHEGKNYTAEPAAHVKLPDGTVLKVVSTDSDGNAQVKVEKKPPASGIVDAFELTAPAEVIAPTLPTGLDALNEDAIREEWSKREAADKAARGIAEEAHRALLEVEAVIAKRLIDAGKNAHAVLPGGISVKGRNDGKLGARLTRVGEKRVVSLNPSKPAAAPDAPPPASDAK